MIRLVRIPYMLNDNNEIVERVDDTVTLHPTFDFREPHIVTAAIDEMLARYTDESDVNKLYDDYKDDE